MKKQRIEFFVTVFVASMAVAALIVGPDIWFSLYPEPMQYHYYR